MTERDARDLVDWLDQAEEETKATIAEHERIDPFYDGVLSTVQTVREYIKKMAVKALEKQRQKKIETWNGQASCPRSKFCGQALDWSDEQ